MLFVAFQEKPKVLDFVSQLSYYFLVSLFSFVFVFFHFSDEICSLKLLVIKEAKASYKQEAEDTGVLSDLAGSCLVSVINIRLCPVSVSGSQRVRLSQQHSCFDTAFP